MAARYASHVSARTTPQSEQIPGTNQVPNSAGGFAFPVDDWTRLDRFLVLGNEGGSYYATERKLTKENAECVLRCLKADVARTIYRIVQVSKEGLAPKNAPAVFALALCMSHGDNQAKRLAAATLPEVARIPTDLFAFVSACQEMRGWGRSLRRAVGDWYNSKELRNLAYQMCKYQSRDGWSHKDLLRLCHVKAEAPRQVISLEDGKKQHQYGSTNDVRAILYRWALRGWPDAGEGEPPQKELHPVWAFERAKSATTKQEIVRLIRQYDLVRECIPTQFLTEPEVWEALLDKMPVGAMVRNLATMTRVGLLAPLSNALRRVQDALRSEDLIRKGRLHPVAVLSALLTYKQGHGEKSKNTWTPVPQVCDALDGAFYLAFKAVEPTNKRWLLALDVSGSMACGNIAGVPGLTPRVGSCAMALITAAVEKQYAFVAFTSGGWHHAGGAGQYSHMGYNNGLTCIDISPKMRLDEVCHKTAALPMGGTDCALPMLWAAANKIPVDVFAVYTDSETWAGGVHPTQALREYRQKMGIPAKMVVVGMVSNGFTIADVNDAGQMDVVGFSTDTPAVMSQFAVQ